MCLRNLHVAASQAHSCPHLGVLDDPQTCLGYPAEWNLCYHARPVAAVSLEQQRKLCLSPVYMQCPVFQREQIAPLPKKLRGVRMPTRWKWVLLTVLILLSALGLWALIRTQAGQIFPLAGAVAFPVASLAGQFSVLPAGLIGANALDPACQAITGWALVPRQSHKSP